MTDLTPPPPLSGGIPPYSLEAEQAVLGLLLRFNEAYDQVAGQLAANDFYSGDHQKIFTATVALIEANKAAEPVTVGQWLKDRGQLDGIGFDYLLELSEQLVSLTSVAAYVEMVREKSAMRALLSASMKLSEMAYATRGQTARQILDEAQAMLAALDERSQRGRGTFRPLSEVFTELLTQIDEAAKANTSTGISTGFRGLDRTLNPLMPGQLVVVGARPAVGKTSLAVNMALHACVHHKIAVGMFSMEMSDIELAVRILSGYSGVAAGRFREHRLGEKEWDRINATLAQFSDAPFHIDQSGGLSIQELTARARVANKQVGGFGLLIVDYVQLSRSEGRNDTRATEIGAVTSGLKRLAKELRCPVLALSQLNRDSAKENKRPSIAELRDSGSIEADADTILLLHRPFVMSQKPEQEFDAEVIVGKQRNGQIGIVDLDYQANLTRFFDRDEAPGRRYATAASYAAAGGG